MIPTLSIRQTMNNLSGIRKAMKTLTRQDVLIGVPADESGREEGDGLNNAELSYIHEFGTEDGRIPPRPHLVPGVKKAQADIADALENAASRALHGDASAVRAGLEKAGLLGQNAVRATFTDNDWPPLAKSTLDAKPLRKSDTGDVLTDGKGRPLREKSRRESGKTNSLMDTRQLQKAHTYVIRDKSAGGDGTKILG